MGGNLEGAEKCNDDNNNRGCPILYIENKIIL
jgi:hypothetical protein